MLVFSVVLIGQDEGLCDAEAMSASRGISLTNNVLDETVAVRVNERILESYMGNDMSWIGTVSRGPLKPEDDIRYTPWIKSVVLIVERTQYTG
jgi:hypothetical protein